VGGGEFQDYENGEALQDELHQFMVDAMNEKWERMKEAEGSMTKTDADGLNRAIARIGNAMDDVKAVKQAANDLCDLLEYEWGLGDGPPEESCKAYLAACKTLARKPKFDCFVDV
jgi:hypothetical protein